MNFSCQAKIARKSRGFTLIELLLAIVIFSTIFYFAYKSLKYLSDAKSIVESKGNMLLIAGRVLQRLERELELITDAPLKKELLSNSPNLLLRSRLYYKETISGDSNIGQLSFVANGAGQYLPNNTKHSGLVQLTYRLARNSDNDYYSLIREEIPFISNKEEALKKKLIFPIASNISHFYLRFYSEKTSAWSSSWGDDKDRLSIPDMIYLSIGFISDNNQHKSFQFITTPIK